LWIINFVPRETWARFGAPFVLVGGDVSRRKRLGRSIVHLAGVGYFGGADQRRIGKGLGFT
jgi:hypothetical protein